MSWKKYFKTYDGMPERMPHLQALVYRQMQTQNDIAVGDPEVYQGQPNRVQRYGQYDQMDLDSEVNTALDTIAEFSTLKNEYTKLPFHVEYNEEASDTENDIIQKSLKQWCNMNEMHKRMFRLLEILLSTVTKSLFVIQKHSNCFGLILQKLKKLLLTKAKVKRLKHIILKIWMSIYKVLTLPQTKINSYTHQLDSHLVLT